MSREEFIKQCIAAGETSLRFALLLNKPRNAKIDLHIRGLREELNRIQGANNGVQNRRD